MKWSIRFTTVLPLAMALAACNSGSGSNGKGDMAVGDGGGNGSGNFSVLSRTTTVAPGAQCPSGGVEVDIGLDNGDGNGVARDNTLQDGEIDSTKYICNPTATTYNTLTATTALPFGDTNCMFGGTRVDFGLDNGDGGGTPNDNILQPGEIDGHQNICLPAPANILVVSTPLFPGDAQCPFGGELVKSGLDNGDGGGTANDGILQDGEIDLGPVARCNPAPVDTFPAPAGAVGTAFINVAGGAIVSTGSNSSAGGNGSISINAYGGSVPTSIETLKAGSVTVNTTVTEPTLTAGAHPIEITADTRIPMKLVNDTTGVTGLYIRVTTVATQPSAWPVFDGATQVTSIHVDAGKKLTFAFGAGQAPALHIDGDIRNEGTITAIDDSDDTNITDLTIECHHFINEATGIVDLRNVGSSDSATLTISAFTSADAQLYNAGQIIVSGRDQTEGAGNTIAGRIVLVSSSDFFNGNSIAAIGGNGTAENAQNTSGGFVDIRTLRGNLTLSATSVIDVSGGHGDEGYGGMLNLHNGAALHDVEKLAPSKFGPGSFNGSGTLRATGADGAANEDGGGSGGGAITIQFFGGNITSNAFIDVHGGAFTGSGYGYASNGGSIAINAYTYTGVDDLSDPVFPSGITIGPAPGATGTGGCLDAHGGASSPGGDGGGDGGEVSITLDLVRTGNGNGSGSGSGSGQPPPPPPFPGPSSNNPIRSNFDVSKLAADASTARIEVIGFGGGFMANGGAGGAYGGSGGSITLQNNVCEIDDFRCAFQRIGARLVSSDLDYHAEGGTGTGIQGGDGGSVSFTISNNHNDLENDNNNMIPGATLDAEQIINKGNLTVYSGDGDSSRGAGEVRFNCEACDTNNQGLLDAHGGNAPTLGSGNNPGTGGTVNVSSFTLTWSGKIDISGGTGGGGQSSMGDVDVTGFRVTSSAPIVSTGYGFKYSFVRYSAAESIINTGNIDASGLNSTPGYAASGGNVSFTAPTITNSGTINTSGEDVTGGYGGAINMTGQSVINSGVLTANAGSYTASSSAAVTGPNGGTITFNAPFCMQTAALSAHGGDATNSGTGPAIGGAGGKIEVDGANLGAFDTHGGAATATGAKTGGTGGSVTVLGANAANLNASGGNATGGIGGSGGTAELGGTNAACINVSGGTGTTAGAAGIITFDVAGTTNSCS